MRLKRELGATGATLLGLGSILGTGVFVSLGLAAGIVGPAVLLAIVLAAAVALCNALSSAQLAASMPVSGGTYEYGHAYLSPALGFTAGWMFLCAKSASAATAALGFAGYLLAAGGVGDDRARIAVALGVTGVLTVIVLGGIRRGNMANAVLVTLTLGSLTLFVLAGTGRAAAGAGEHLRPFFGTPAEGAAADAPLVALLHATALLFVAYTGYGRIATLGEEVRDPARTLPRAIVVTLGVSMLVYLLVAFVAVASVGSARFHDATREEAAPLEVIAGNIWGMPAVGWMMTIGAITAMGGVLLNLILGLSRVALAMGRRGEMPAALARLDRSGATPVAAVIAVAVAIAALVLIGDVLATWSLSAFTVLVYYGLTNAAALRLPRGRRRYHPAVAWCGLIACAGLALSIDLRTIALGAAVLGAGLIWFGIARLLRG